MTHDNEKIKIVVPSTEFDDDLTIDSGNRVLVKDFNGE